MEITIGSTHYAFYPDTSLLLRSQKIGREGRFDPAFDSTVSRKRLTLDEHCRVSELFLQIRNAARLLDGVGADDRPTLSGAVADIATTEMQASIDAVGRELEEREGETLEVGEMEADLISDLRGGHAYAGRPYDYADDLAMTAEMEDRYGSIV